MLRNIKMFVFLHRYLEMHCEGKGRSHCCTIGASIRCFVWLSDKSPPLARHCTIYNVHSQLNQEVGRWRYAKLTRVLSLFYPYSAARPSVNISYQFYPLYCGESKVFCCDFKERWQVIAQKRIDFRNMDQFLLFGSVPCQRCISLTWTSPRMLWSNTALITSIDGFRCCSISREVCSWALFLHEETVQSNVQMAWDSLLLMENFGWITDAFLCIRWGISDLAGIS